MKTTHETSFSSEEVEEPKPFSSNHLLTELTVQLWQLLTTVYTGYKRALWLNQHQRTRLQLLDLSDEQLKDIGISRTAANKEANKLFWE